MISDPVLIAIISALGLILSGVLVEAVRTRRRTDAVLSSVTPNGGASLRDAVDRIGRQVEAIGAEQNRHGARLATVEAILNERRRDTGMRY